MRKVAVMHQNRFTNRQNKRKKKNTRKGIWDITEERFCVLVSETVDKAKKMSMYRHFMVGALRHISRRSIGTSVCRQVENKVPLKQKMFQEDNGIPIHLKGGPKDALLYRATMTLTIGGTAYLLYELFNAACPKKKD
ncbi:cytochrome c oxidase subunit 7A2, mitochondrial-like isoform X1 [Alosa alosa]|uniref:cytochrome c oxidase subunit 7A2, mitochondrial-like isoform X1 n=1 Tax=Alosa alosa TaxID=278164 RepID=UPI0020152ECF|nr:cytochrome c oxidase subunit 7A2, mitochondrial-like isoform X1 [Alosa alosa]